MHQMPTARLSLAAKKSKCEIKACRTVAVKFLNTHESPLKNGLGNFSLKTIGEIEFFYLICSCFFMKASKIFRVKV